MARQRKAATAKAKTAKPVTAKKKEVAPIMRKWSQEVFILVCVAVSAWLIGSAVIAVALNQASIELGVGLFAVGLCVMIATMIIAAKFERGGKNA